MQSWAINNALGGALPGLTSSAVRMLQSGLDGEESPSQARRENAYFGAQSGLDPTSDYLRNRGYDLYNERANKKKRETLGDFLSLIGTYSGNVAPTPGQELQNTQAQGQLALGNRSLEQEGSQFQQNFGFEQQQWQKQLELLQQMLNPAGGTGGGGAYGTPGGKNTVTPSFQTNANYDYYSNGMFAQKPRNTFSLG